MHRKNILFVILSLLLISFVYAEEVSLDTYVNDYTNSVDLETKEKISVVLQSLHEQGLAEYAVVIVQSLEGRDINEYALDLAHEKLGDEKKDNGLLLLIAKEERKYRYEVGLGLEGSLNDAKIGRIAREYLVPYLKEDNYGEGILQASYAVYQELGGSDDIPISVAQKPVAKVSNSSYFWNFLFFIIIMIIFSSRSSKRRKRRDDGYFESAMLASVLFGGRGRGGNFGGGFGGFSGGGFGGGGAGGSF